MYKPWNYATEPQSVDKEALKKINAEETQNRGAVKNQAETASTNATASPLENPTFPVDE